MSLWYFHCSISVLSYTTNNKILLVITMVIILPFIIIILLHHVDNNPLLIFFSVFIITIFGWEWFLCLFMRVTPGACVEGGGNCHPWLSKMFFHCGFQLYFKSIGCFPWRLERFLNGRRVVYNNGTLNDEIVTPVIARYYSVTL